MVLVSAVGGKFNPMCLPFNSAHPHPPSSNSILCHFHQHCPHSSSTQFIVMLSPGDCGSMKLHKTCWQGVVGGWWDFKWVDGFLKRFMDFFSPSLHPHHKACFPDTLPGGACGSMKLSWAGCGGLLGFLVGGWISQKIYGFCCSCPLSSSPAPQPYTVTCSGTQNMRKVQKISRVTSCLAGGRWVRWSGSMSK